MNETLAEDGDLIPFEGTNLTLFAGAMRLAGDGVPMTYARSMESNNLERGAELVLAKLRAGEWRATGINPTTMMREAIGTECWELAQYNPPLFKRCHHMDFVEREGGETDTRPVGLAGTLELYDNAKRWFNIRVFLPEAHAVVPNVNAEVIIAPAEAALDQPSGSELRTAKAIVVRRGRPPKYDWGSFVEEAQNQLEYRGDFDPSFEIEWNQAALERHMADWCESSRWSQLPSESTIRKRVVEAYNCFKRSKADN